MAKHKRRKKAHKVSSKKYWSIVLSLTAVMILVGVWAVKNFIERERLLTQLKNKKEQVERTKPAPKKEIKKLADTIKEKILSERDEPKAEPVKDATPASNDPKTAAAGADYYYYTRSFDFAWPAYESADQVVEHSHYTLNYEEKYEQASWVAYHLTKDELVKTAKRKDDFRDDPDIRTGSASKKDYVRTGYDRGHLAPAADFSWDATAMSESFYMSNMSPQDPGFNRGIWKKLEAQVRDWAMEEGELYVVTGPVLENGLKKIGKNKVAVPNMYYKIILDIQEPEIKAIGFLMKNESSKAPLKSFVVPIDSIEKITGEDFFPMIPDHLEFELESRAYPDMWF